MMEILKHCQIELLKILGIVCVIIGLFSLVIKYRSLRMKKAIVGLEFGAGTLLIADMASYFYDGNQSTAGHLILRISTFLLYFMICFEMYAFNSFVCSNIMGREKLRVLPKRIPAGFMISSAGMTMAAVAHFTGLYYTIDAGNDYQRSPFFIISYVFPIAAMIIQLSLIVQYRKFFEHFQEDRIQVIGNAEYAYITSEPEEKISSETGAATAGAAASGFFAGSSSFLPVFAIAAMILLEREIRMYISKRTAKTTSMTIPASMSISPVGRCVPRSTAN